MISQHLLLQAQLLTKQLLLPGNWKTSTEAGTSTVSVNTDLIVGYEYEFEVELPKVFVYQTRR